MRSKEEVERMFDMTKKQLEEIMDSERTGDRLQEDRRLLLTAQLSMLSWVLGREGDDSVRNEKSL